MQSILALVAGGVGIALVPQAMLAMKIPHVVFLEVLRARAAVKYRLCLAFHPANRNPALAAFVTMVRGNSGAEQGRSAGSK
jgi:DNA-binding transcriptional LysR family regulator